MPSSIPRLFVETELSSDYTLALSKAHTHYLLHVLRLKTGDRVALFNGRDGEWEAELHQSGKHTLEATIQTQRRIQEYEPPLTLLFAPVKGGRTESILQKATELGATHIQPVHTRFTVIPRLNTERCHAQIVEASEQCERLTIPELAAMQPLYNVLGTRSAGQMLLFCDESGMGTSLLQVVQQLSRDGRAKNLAVLVGPEGGFSPEERQLLLNMDSVIAVSLGSHILRADTAVAAALALVQAGRDSAQSSL